MTILLTGATGFLGSYLLRNFIKKGYVIIALKRSSSNCDRIVDLLDTCKSYNVDQINIAEIFSDNKIDIVINTVTNYGRKNGGVLPVVSTNLLFSLEILEKSIQHNIKAFINTDTLLSKEISAYSLSKSQFVDWMKFLSNNHTKKINLKIEHMFGPKDDENKFIFWLINKLKNNCSSIDLTNGTQKRDFIYIDDIVEAYNAIIEHLDSFQEYEEVEIGSGNPIEVKEVIKKIYENLSQLQPINTKLNFGAVAYRTNESMCMQANITKLKKIGWKPKVSIEEGIKRILFGAKND